MTKTLICDCFNLGDERIYAGEKCYKGTERGNGLVELDNGVWLKSCGDGRYYKDDDENSRWATVQTLEFDENGDMIQDIEFLGYTEIQPSSKKMSKNIKLRTDLSKKERRSYQQEYILGKRVKADENSDFIRYLYEKNTQEEISAWIKSDESKDISDDLRGEIEYRVEMYDERKKYGKVVFYVETADFRFGMYDVTLNDCLEEFDNFDDAKRFAVDKFFSEYNYTDWKKESRSLGYFVSVESLEMLEARAAANAAAAAEGIAKEDIDDYVEKYLNGIPQLNFSLEVRFDISPETADEYVEAQEYEKDEDDED